MSILAKHLKEIIDRIIDLESFENKVDRRIKLKASKNERDRIRSGLDELKIINMDTKKELKEIVLESLSLKENKRIA